MRVDAIGGNGPELVLQMVWLRRQFLQGLESVSDQGAEQRTEHGVRWATCVAPPGAFLSGHEFPALPCWATLCRPSGLGREKTELNVVPRTFARHPAVALRFFLLFRSKSIVW